MIGKLDWEFLSFLTTQLPYTTKLPKLEFRQPSLTQLSQFSNTITIMISFV